MSTNEASVLYWPTNSGVVPFPPGTPALPELRQTKLDGRGVP